MTSSNFTSFQFDNFTGTLDLDPSDIAENSSSSSEFTVFHNTSSTKIQTPLLCSGSPWYSFWIGGVATSSLCTFAIFGNLVCIAVLSRRSMRSSVNGILLALSGSDFVHVSTCLLIRGANRTLQHFCIGDSYTHFFQPLALPYLFPIGTTGKEVASYVAIR
jgi:hypothetical protein